MKEKGRGPKEHDRNKKNRVKKRREKKNVRSLEALGAGKQRNKAARLGGRGESGDQDMGEMTRSWPGKHSFDRERL